MEYANQTWRIFFEAAPMLVAFVTIILGVFRAITSTTQHFRNVAWQFVAASVLLIIAQSSWSWTMFIKHDMLGTDFANIIWTLFNLLVMCSMVYVLRGEKR